MARNGGELEGLSGAGRVYGTSEIAVNYTPGHNISVIRCVSVQFWFVKSKMELDIQYVRLCIHFSKVDDFRKLGNMRIRKLGGDTT